LCKYVGKEYTKDGSPLTVCKQLVEQAGLTSARGRVLTIDNWYTLIQLAQYFFEKYAWTIVGMIVATDKQARAKLGLPFNKLTKGAL
jgi:hypothetical protein